MPLDVSGRRVPRGLPGVLLRLRGRRSETSLAGGVQRGPVSRSRLSGTRGLGCFIRRPSPINCSRSQDDFGDFRLADHADYLDELARKHQRTVSKTLDSEFDTS